MPLLVTAFDETTAAQLEELGDVEVTSMADIVAPSLAGPCLGEDLESVRIGEDGPVGLKTTGERVEEVADRGARAPAGAGDPPRARPAV